MSRPPPSLQALQAIQPVYRYLTAGATVWRCHQQVHGAEWYSRNGTQRFDDPAQIFGVMYCSLSVTGALAETILHGRLSGSYVSNRPYLTTVNPQQFVLRVLTQLTFSRRMRFVSFLGQGHTVLGVDASIQSVVGSAGYAMCGAWSQAIRLAYPDVDGLVYRCRHVDSETSVALFDRAADAVQFGSPVAISPTHRNSFLRKLHLGLEP